MLRYLQQESGVSETSYLYSTTTLYLHPWECQMSHVRNKFSLTVCKTRCPSGANGCLTRHEGHILLTSKYPYCCHKNTRRSTRWDIGVKSTVSQSTSQRAILKFSHRPAGHPSTLLVCPLSCGMLFHSTVYKPHTSYFTVRYP